MNPTLPSRPVQPRGIRNNNFGNIEDGPFTRGLPGYTGSDGRFATFDSAQNGLGAIDALLGSYGRKGVNSISGVINRWAPTSDGNNVGAYGSYVGKQMGIDPNASVDMNDPAVRQKMARAMAEFENGPSAMQAVFDGSGGGGEALGYASSPRPVSAGPTRLEVTPRGADVVQPDQVTPGVGVQQPQQPWTPLGWLSGKIGLPDDYDLEGRLGRAGAIAIALDDPKAAAATASLFPRLAAADPGQWDHVISKDGNSIVRIHKQTGRVDQIPIRQTQEPEKVGDTVIKDLSEKNSNYAAVFDTAKEAAELKKAIDEGRLDPSWAGAKDAIVAASPGSWLAEKLGWTSDDAARMYNRYQAFRARVANAELRLNTGTQTDADYARSREGLVPLLASQDPASVSDALNDYIIRTRDTAHRSFGDTVNSYKSNNPKAPTGVFSPYEKAIEDQRRFYEIYTAQRPAKPAIGTFKPSERPPLDSFYRQ